MDDAVLLTLEGVVFSKEFIESVLSTVDVDASEKENAALLAVEEKATKEIGTLIALAKAGDGHIPAVAEAIRQSNEDLENARRRRRELATRQRPQREQLKEAIQQTIDGWREVLRLHAPQAKLLVRQLLNGGVRIDPDDVEGINAKNEAYVATKGVAVWGAELDLEAALGQYKCLASPTGFEPVFQP
jgi:hypothetical protein